MDRAEFLAFLENVRFTDTCWYWQGPVNDDGYGRFHYLGKKYYAHRFSYMTFVGELIKGLQIDHVKELCSHRCCVNPDHLEQVTGAENTRRGARTLKIGDRCRKGLHDMVDPNIIWKSNGTKQCRDCKNDAQRRRRNG